MKYDPKGKFQDPVVRCGECSKIVLHQGIVDTGCCPNCGAGRVRNLRVFNSEEKKQMEEWGVDPDFISLFEGVE